MNEEEAIEYIEQFIGIKKEYKCKPIKVKTLNNTREAIETVLNLLEKKNKIIDLMAEEFENLKLAYFKKEDGGEFMGKYRTYNKNDWKQYFERKVENGN